MGRHDRETVKVATKEATRLAADNARRTGLAALVVVIGVVLLVALV